MSDPVILGIVTSIAPTLVAVAALYQAYRVGKEVNQVHLTVNSRMDQLLAITAAKSKAEGVKEGEEAVEGVKSP